MRVKYFFMLSLLLINVSALANAPETSNNTIPFIIYKPQPISYPYYISGPPMQALMPSKVYLSENSGIMQQVNIPYDQIKNAIKDIQNKVCSVVTDNTDIRVWFSTDTSGKLFGIGAAAQSGIEITFHCGKQAKIN